MGIIGGPVQIASAIGTNALVQISFVMPINDVIVNVSASGGSIGSSIFMNLNGVLAANNGGVETEHGVAFVLSARGSGLATAPDASSPAQLAAVAGFAQNSVQPGTLVNVQCPAGGVGVTVTMRAISAGLV